MTYLLFLIMIISFQSGVIGRFENFKELIQRSDSDLTQSDQITDFNACNYQTRNFTLYHLNNINNADGGSGTQQIVVQNSSQHVAVFNYCKYPIKQQVFKCTYQDKNANAVLMPNMHQKDADCVNFDQGELKDINQVDKNGNIVGFNITYSQSDKMKQTQLQCPFGRFTVDYKMSVITYCNQRYDQLVELKNNETGFSEICHPQFVYYTKKACPLYQVDRFQVMIHGNLQLIATSMVIFGLALAFGGHMYPQHSIFLASYNLGFLGFTDVFFKIFMSGLPVNYNFIPVPIFMILGLIPAYYLAKYEKIGIIWMSTVCGALFGALIDLNFQQKGGLGLFYSLVVILGIAGGICAYFFHSIFIILMTSFIGSYKVIRGISYFAGGFPKEAEQTLLIKLNDVIHPYFSKAYYGYFPGILVLFALSTWFQFWKRANSASVMPNISEPKPVYFSLPDEDRASDNKQSGINDSEIGSSREGTNTEVENKFTVDGDEI